MKKHLLPIITAALIAFPIGPVLAHKHTEGMMGEHDMTGTVKQLDPKTGTFTLESAGALPLRLHFPPEQLKGVKEGDTITVHMGFTKGGGDGGDPAK